MESFVGLSLLLLQVTSTHKKRISMFTSSCPPDLQWQQYHKTAIPQNITKLICLINFATQNVFFTPNPKNPHFFLFKISIFCLSKLAYSHKQMTWDIAQLSCINRSCLITFQLRPPKSTHKICCWSLEVVQWPWSFSNSVTHLMQARNQLPCLLRTEYLL